MHFVARRLDQGDRAADRAGSQHGPARRCAGERRRRVLAARRRASKLDPFKDEIHRLLKDDPKLPGQRVRELIAPLGFDGGKTIVDDYLREVRPLFAPPRTFQRTVYRPGEICQFDLWEPSARSRSGTARPAGLGRGRVLGLLARGRRRAGLLQADAGSAVRDPRAACGRWGRCRRRWSGTARPGCTPATGGRRRRSPRSAAQLQVGWHFCEPRDPQAKGVVERLQDFIERSFEPGRRVRQRARLPAAARRAGSTSARTRGCTRRCAAGRSTGSSRSGE